MQRLGKGLKDLPRAEFVLATKFGRYGPNLFDFSAERVHGEIWLCINVIKKVKFYKINV
jgi:aryl-alcohol dehydrogenase-like predicted oxidoreductase